MEALKSLPVAVIGAAAAYLNVRGIPFILFEAGSTVASNILHGNTFVYSRPGAIGTLMGGFLITSPYVNHVLVFAIFSLLILLLVHLGTAQRALKTLYLWK